MIIKIKRGTSTNVGALKLLRGELAFTTDTKDLYVGTLETEGTTKIKLTNNDVYTPLEYAKYLAKSDDILDHGAGDYIPIGPSGAVPEQYYPPSIMGEVRFVSVLPASGANDKLYVVTGAGANLNTIWVYRSDTWIKLKQWSTLEFDGGTF